MMLRSRNTNVAQNNAAPNGKNADVAVKRTAAKPASSAEPLPKRLVLNEISQGISSFLIDSTKKQDLKNVVPRRSLQKSENASENEEVKNGRVTRSKGSLDPAPEYDYDAQCARDRDEYAVPEFAFDIFAYSRSREKLFSVPDYMKRFSQFTPQIRSKIVDWMVEMQETFELNHETLYLSVKLWDLFMSRTIDTTANSIQGELAAAVCVFVASKFDERSPPLIDDFLYISEDKFTRKEFIAMEMLLLDVIGFDLGCPLSYVYLRRLARVTSTDMTVLTLSRYILETSLCFYEFVGVRESLLASGAFYLALRMTNQEAIWSPVLHKYSGYNLSAIEPFADELNLMLHRQRARNFAESKTVYAKYSHQVFHEVALIPLLPCKYDIKRPLMQGKPFNFQSPIRK